MKTDTRYAKCLSLSYDLLVMALSYDLLVTDYGKDLSTKLWPGG